MDIDISAVKTGVGSSGVESVNGVKKGYICKTFNNKDKKVINN